MKKLRFREAKESKLTLRVKQVKGRAGMGSRTGWIS